MDVNQVNFSNTTLSSGVPSRLPLEGTPDGTCAVTESKDTYVSSVKQKRTSSLKSEIIGVHSPEKTGEAAAAVPKPASVQAATASEKAAPAVPVTITEFGGEMKLSHCEMKPAGPVAEKSGVKGQRPTVLAQAVRVTRRLENSLLSLVGLGDPVEAMKPTVEAINALEPAMRALPDEALRAKTAEFKDRLAKGETADELMIEAYAVAREAARRVNGTRHYDVQLLGGIALHRNQVAEMATGEGKTLTAVLPVYLNALAGKGVHVVTVNETLAERDSQWMGRIYRFLGLSAGCIKESMTPEQRRQAYDCDITYLTNTTLGFDYLRDNLAHRLSYR